jgi:hypothetical protein
MVKAFSNFLLHNIITKSRFYAGSSIANMFGGLLSGAVLGNMEVSHGLSGWKWLFIVEGTITFGEALIAAYILFRSFKLPGEVLTAAEYSSLTSQQP